VPGLSAPPLLPSPSIFSSFSWLDIAILVGESSPRNAIAPLARSSHCLEIRGRRDRRRYTLQPPLAPSPSFTIPRSFLLVPRASPASAEPLPFLVRATYAHVPPSSFSCTQFVPFEAGTRREFHFVAVLFCIAGPATAILRGDRLGRAKTLSVPSLVPTFSVPSLRLRRFDDRCLHFCVCR